MAAGRFGTSASTLAAAARGVVFDKDGTLFDLDARWLPYFRSFIDGVARRCAEPSLVPPLAQVLGVEPGGLTPDRPAAIETGAHLRALAVSVLVEFGRDPEQSAEIVLAAEAAATPGLLTLLGDVTPALRKLAVGGRRLGIATSDGRSNTVAELAQFDVLALVDTMRCGDDPGPVKPDPGVLLSIADEWGLSPSAMLYVGDNRHDRATARAAGVPFVAVSRVGTDPWSDDPGDAQVFSIDELLG